MDFPPPPVYGTISPMGYEVLEKMNPVIVNRKSENVFEKSCCGVGCPCVFCIANTGEEKELFEMSTATWSSESGPVLLKQELMRKVSCICGIGDFEYKIALKVVNGPVLCEMKDKDGIMSFMQSFQKKYREVVLKSRRVKHIAC